MYVLSSRVITQRLCLSTPAGTVVSNKKEKDAQMRERIVRRAAAEFKVKGARMTPLL